MSLQLKLLLIVSAIGIFDTLYLIYNKIRGTDVLCLFFPKKWCKKVQHSKQSKTFGIPNSYAGFVMYTFIFICTILYAYSVTMLFWPIQIVVAIGFLFSIYFLYVQGFVLKAFCTWCVLSAINFTILAYATFLL
ncbi:MAG: vitamin K epoxide reductase family protein [Candidatus Magasanikbacteria bacterium]|nr:vitamin K epoxide reductase family protein [Candidatus Magasanikbacteria bacterium]